MVDEKQISTEPIEYDRWDKLCDNIRRDYKGELIIAVDDITR